jgi:hypothetical protein
LFYWFDAISLAYWIMCDGSWAGGGLVLWTNSYNFQSLQIMLIILTNKFDLDCTLQIANKDKGQYKIYIRARSVPHLRSLVLPHFHSSFYYKLGMPNPINKIS